MKGGPGWTCQRVTSFFGGRHWYGIPCGTVEIDGEGRYLLLVDDVKRYFGTIVERHQRESVDDARQELRPEVALPEMQHLR